MIGGGEPVGVLGFPAMGQGVKISVRRKPSARVVVELYMPQLKTPHVARFTAAQATELADLLKQAALKLAD